MMQFINNEQSEVYVNVSDLPDTSTTNRLAAPGE